MAQVVLFVPGFAEGFEWSSWTGALEVRSDLEAGSPYKCYCDNDLSNYDILFQNGSPDSDDLFIDK